MKKLFLIAFTLITTLIYSQVMVLDVVTPAGNFSSTNTSYVKGSLKNVTHHADLFTIPVDRLELGMIASVADSSYGLFQLTAIVPIMTWEKLTIEAEAIESDPIIYGVYRMNSIDSVLTQINAPFSDSVLISESGIYNFVDSLLADIELVKVDDYLSTISLDAPGVQSAKIYLRSDELGFAARDGINIGGSVYLIPMLTTPTVAAGKLYVNGSNQLMYYNGTAWVDISAQGDSDGNPILQDVTVEDTTRWGIYTPQTGYLYSIPSGGLRIKGRENLSGRGGDLGLFSLEIPTGSYSNMDYGARGDYSIAIGHETYINSTSDNSIAIGYGAQVTGGIPSGGSPGGIAIGHFSMSLGGASIAIGSSRAYGAYSVAIGSARANGIRSFAMGYSFSDGAGSTAIGGNVNTSGGYYSYYKNRSGGYGSFVAGNGNRTGLYSDATYDTYVSGGEFGTATGFCTAAIGRASWTSGYGTGYNTAVFASGGYSFAHQYVSLASKDAASTYSVILGGLNNTIPTSKIGSIILGGNTITAAKPWTAYVQNLKIASGDTLWFGDGTFQATAAATGGISDAPNDGNIYGRQNLSWTAINTGSGNPILANVTTSDTTRWGEGGIVETGTYVFEGDNLMVGNPQYFLGGKETLPANDNGVVDVYTFGRNPMTMTYGLPIVLMYDSTMIDLHDKMAINKEYGDTHYAAIGSGGSGNPVLANVTTTDTTRWALDTKLTDGEIGTMGYIKSYTETDPMFDSYSFVSTELDSSLYLGTSMAATTILKDGTVLVGSRSGLNASDLRWSTGIGYQTLKNNQAFCITSVGASSGRSVVGSYNGFFGTWAGRNYAGTLSLGIGDGAASYAGGTSNSYIGVNAGIGTSTIKNIWDYQVGIGAGALSYNTNAGNNVGIGNKAGYKWDGAYNVLIGPLVGEESDGYQTVLIGDASGYKGGEFDFSVGVGASTFYKGNSKKSTAIGSGAMQRQNSDNNIGIGHLALSHSYTHSNNIRIGNQLDTLVPYRTVYDSTIVIGNYLLPTEDKQMLLGGAYTKNVKFNATGALQWNTDTLATLSNVRNVTSNDIVIESDPIFSAWDKDYTDLINKPTIQDWEQAGMGTIDKSNIDLDYTDLSRLLEGSHGIKIEGNAQVKLADSLFEGIEMDLNGNYLNFYDNSSASSLYIDDESASIGGEIVSLNGTNTNISGTTSVNVTSPNLKWTNYSGNITANENIITKGYADGVYVNDDVEYSYVENASRQMKSISSTTPVINFNDVDDVWNYTVNANITFQSVTNASSARSKIFTIRMISDASAHNLAFPTSWSWTGGKPTQILANTKAILTVQNFGSGDSNIVASYVILSNGE